MGSSVQSEESCISTKSSLIGKSTVVEETLQQSLVNFRELIKEFTRVLTKQEAYKAELATLKKKCESKTCNSSEVLKKIIESKDVIIHLAASAITKLNETKNLELTSEVLKILCGEATTLSPPEEQIEVLDINKIKMDVDTHPQNNTPAKLPLKNKLLTPKKELENSIEDISFKEESITEIDATPGRTSPIIYPKKLKSSSNSSCSMNSTDSREKKKCPDGWLTPNSKQMKLTYTKSSARSKQSKICFTVTKATSVVDLTCSPDVYGGRAQGEPDTPKREKQAHPHVQMLIKKESSDNDDTILPSPTSSGAPPHFPSSKTTIKEQLKAKKPLSLNKTKMETEEPCSPIIQVVDSRLKDFLNDPEESINILKPKRFPKSPHKASPRKPSTTKLQIKIVSSIKPEPLSQEPQVKIVESPLSQEARIKIAQSPLSQEARIKIVQSPLKVNNEDMTHCEDASMSLLHRVGNIEEKSPTKRPLAELVDFTNKPQDGDSSLSLLIPERVEGNVKRKLVENVEPVKELNVRKKAEKMVLPSWCCDECKGFLGTLYSSPEQIAAAIARCSKHRRPRPATPPGFWQPRWTVPSDTDDFNRANGVD